MAGTALLATAPLFTESALGFRGWDALVLQSNRTASSVTLDLSCSQKPGVFSTSENDDVRLRPLLFAVCSGLLLLFVTYWCSRLTRWIRDQRKSLFILHKMYADAQAECAADLIRQLPVVDTGTALESCGYEQLRALQKYQLNQSVFNCQVDSIKLWMDAQLSTHGGFSLWGVSSTQRNNTACQCSCLHTGADECCLFLGAYYHYGHSRSSLVCSRLPNRYDL
eukprot:SAG31_NODE_10752_length_1102_cov_0.843470_1_plen_222_part_10